MADDEDFSFLESDIPCDSLTAIRYLCSQFPSTSGESLLSPHCTPRVCAGAVVAEEGALLGAGAASCQPLRVSTGEGAVRRRLPGQGSPCSVKLTSGACMALWSASTGFMTLSIELCFNLKNVLFPLAFPRRDPWQLSRDSALLLSTVRSMRVFPTGQQSTGSYRRVTASPLGPCFLHLDCTRASTFPSGALIPELVGERFQR